MELSIDGELNERVKEHEYLAWLEFEVRSKEYTDDEELYDLAVKYFYSFKQPLIWVPISLMF
jgi:hypothetical protein